MSSSSTTANAPSPSGGLLSQLAAAKALIGEGRPDAAVQAARETALLYPGVAPAALGLGEALLAAGHLPTAIAEFQRALRLDPELDDARYGVGRAWLEAGEADKALEAFGALDADCVSGLAGMIARANAMKGQQRSDAGYVRHLFDQFSADYDERMLGQLCYNVPLQLRRLANLVIQPPAKQIILDLGCGTGLSGAAFKDMATRLDGVDLSPCMIEKARQRGIYDALSVGDIETALSDTRDDYTLVLAADTLVYLGDLEKVFAGVVRALKDSGLFLFTVEAKEGEGFGLGPKRRWQHSESYIREEAAKAHMETCGFMQCDLRTEAGKPVAGYAAALQKPDRFAK